MSLKGRTLVAIKPSTYMNLSGKAIRYWMQKEDIPKENILVIVDDLALPLGTLRLKAKGSDGGHNGLISIIELIETTDFARLCHLDCTDVTLAAEFSDNDFDLPANSSLRLSVTTRKPLTEALLTVEHWGSKSA